SPITRHRWRRIPMSSGASIAWARRADRCTVSSDRARSDRFDDDTLRTPLSEAGRTMSQPDSEPTGPCYEGITVAQWLALAIAAALVSAPCATSARAFAAGIFHASSILGVALASWTGIIFNRADQWRWGFLVGLAPTLLIVWIRMSMKEPERWEAEKKKSEGL